MTKRALSAAIGLAAVLGLAAFLAAGAQGSLPVRSRIPGLATDSSTYRPAFYFPIDIDYGHPDAYLQPGSQSALSLTSATAVADEIGAPAPGLPTIAAVFRWMTSTFTTEPSGGQDIGKTTADGLIASRTLTGCHDWALVMTSVIRHYGIPAVMVDAAGIQWAHDFHDGKTMAHIGHVYAEAFVEGRWIAIDCTTGRYVWDYDPLQPAIPLTSPVEPVGLYTMFKGVDPAGYGVTESETLGERFRQFAAAIENITVHIPKYDFRDLRDVR